METPDPDQPKKDERVDPARLMRLLFTPTRTEPSDAARQVLDRASVEKAVVDGDEVVHHVWGDGERRVLLAHGWSGNAGHMTDLADAFAAAGFTVVAPDLPGHGRSAGDLSSVIHFARTIEAANERYGPFHAVVAHSISAVATTYALSRGLGCERAVFFNPLGSFTSLWRRNEEVLHLPPKLMSRIVGLAEEWLEISFEKIEPVTLAAQLSTPLLVFHDEHDPEVRMADIEVLVQAWPGAQLVKVEKLGHTRILGNEEMVRRAVDFVGAPDGPAR